MAANKIVVQLTCLDAYDALDLETGEIASQDLYNVISCDIEPGKDFLEYQNINLGTNPRPEGMSHEPFTEKVSEMGVLDSLELKTLATRDIEIVYNQPQTS